jgi:hypothetical protein
MIDDKFVCVVLKIQFEASASTLQGSAPFHFSIRKKKANADAPIARHNNFLTKNEIAKTTLLS